MSPPATFIWRHLRHPYRRITLVGVVALTAVVLFACDKGGGDQSNSGNASTAQGAEPRIGGSIIRHLESDCKTLNWVLYTTVYEDYVIRYLYDNLLDYNENLEIVPVLAKDFEISKDHLEITVRLKENLVWHDGEPITADDIKFTVEAILNPAIPAVNKEGWFSRLDKVEVVDPHTVIFRWKEAYAPALHALTQLAPIPRHVYDVPDFLTNPANRAPVGSGAFKFEEWRTNQTITIVRNESYHGKNAYLDRITFRIIPDRAVALNALKAGELDEMRVGQIQWEKQTSDPEFERRFNKTYYDVPQYNYMSWNCRSVWFSDKRVRIAMSLLFDRELVNDKVYSGYAKLVSGPFYINSWAYDRTIAPRKFDPTEAARLLDEAGWVDSDGDGVRDKDGVKFEFEFFIAAGSRISSDMVLVFQEQCSKSGINLKIRQIEGATFFDTVFKGEYDAALLAWRLDIDPDLYDTFHSSQVPPIGLNHAFYSNSRVDSLLVLGRTEFDKEKRAHIYRQVHQLIHDDPPYTFINSVPEKRPIHKRIRNVTISPDGPFRFYPGGIYWYVNDDSKDAVP